MRDEDSVVLCRGCAFLTLLGGEERDSGFVCLEWKPSG
jgi:hypothetical protein